MTTAKAIVVLLVCIAALGCGGSGTGASLYGKVTLDGAPIEQGTLQFVPSDGKGQPVGANVVAGAYQVDDVPAGPVAVNIDARKQTGVMDIGSGRTAPKLESIIPDKYSQGISIEVKRGKREQNFELSH
jgi:hypothetical protein